MHSLKVLHGSTPHHREMRVEPDTQQCGLGQYDCRPGRLGNLGCEHWVFKYVPDRRKRLPRPASRQN